MSSDEVFVKIHTAMERVFPGRSPMISLGNPNKQVKDIPAERSDNCVSDGDFTIDERKTVKHEGNLYYRAIVDRDATFFVSWGTRTYQVYCTKDVDIDMMVAVVKRKLGG